MAFLSICLSVCLSRWDFLSKWIHISSNYFRHLAGQHSSFCSPVIVTIFNGNPSTQALSTAVRKICVFWPKLPFISETVRDRSVVTVDNRMSRVSAGCMSLLMTLKGEKWDAQFFRWIIVRTRMQAPFHQQPSKLACHPMWGRACY